MPVPAKNPVVAGNTAVLLVSVSDWSKPLTTWKSNTSLYMPPAQPSLIVNGAFEQLLILIAGFPSLNVS